MSAIMKVMLTDHAADAQWGDKALTSFNQNGVAIHLNGDEAERLRQIQRAGRRLDAQGIKQLALTGTEWDLERRYAFYQGFYNPRAGQSLYLGDMPAEEQKQLDSLLEATRWVRQITNGTPEEIYPQSLAEQAADFIARQAWEKVSFEIISGDALLEQGHVGIYQVGRGSVRAPVLLKLDFNPSGDAQAPVAACLVGKGITFDSGGYSLKSSDNMLPMKSDMGGAAMVSGALALAIRQGLNQRVQLFLCCAENLVSGHAFKLGDILTYRNGVSVEILNTDAEGRLVLADGLLCAADSGAKHILDAATLTGAAKMALGRDYHAVFSLDEARSQQLCHFAKAVNEKAWALPLEPWHLAQLTSSFAELGNVASAEGTAGATTAAAFLSRFVPADVDWMHMDLSASYQKNGNDLWAPGGKGHGVRTIARWLLEVTAK
ncbi:aminopeptidase PepB [Pseudaeromonas sharmana]|uniref:Aminopeptidase PepB n=1 Tax=Pseudaeromonas sharmana TaxID=328412 RepID=A0ABV8CSS7_9GAMM